MRLYASQIFVLVLMLTVLFTGCSSDKPKSVQAQPENRAQAFPQGAEALPLLREIWRFGADNIYPRTLAERFDAATLKQFESALRADNELALADVLNPFLDSLNVSHTRLFDRRHQGYYMLRSLFSTRNPDSPALYTLGVQLDDRLPGKVSAVLDGSPSAIAGLKRGYRIVEVDGAPFESLLQWQHTGPVQLTVETGSGRRNFSLNPIRQGYHRSLVLASQASERTINCRDRRIGYFHLWSGTGNGFLAALKGAVNRAVAAELDGYVLDLRDGHGGAWWAYLDSFFTDRSGYFSFVTHDASGQGEKVFAEPRNNESVWNGPLAVIINSGTRSGKESLAFQFKHSGRAKLFGSTTAGAFTSGRGVFADRDVNYLLYLAVAERRLNGVAIERVGVAPDVVVSEQPGSDAPLEAALDYLQC